MKLKELFALSVAVSGRDALQFYESHAVTNGYELYIACAVFGHGLNFLVFLITGDAGRLQIVLAIPHASLQGVKEQNIQFTYTFSL